MRLVLAPMEGLADAPMRALLTASGGYDWCVSEFVRINSDLLPPRVFRRRIPESENGFRTSAGTPVHVQLLGSDPFALAENAAQVAGLGAPAIDLNFGCPAKTVNRHRGGAVLLEQTELLHAIVVAVRQAVPAGVPVSAKIRLGYADTARLEDNVRALVEAGVSWLTVHARTKEDGYRPPAHWHELRRVQAVAAGVPVIANGEVWTAADHARCVAESGCEDVMIGRGAVAWPLLAMAIRAGVAGAHPQEPCWAPICGMLADFLDGADDAVGDTVLLGRLKQWLAFLAKRFPEAGVLLARVRPLRERQVARAAIDESRAVSLRG